MARKTNIVIDQGTDYSRVIDANTNLTGYTVRSQMRKNYSTTNAYDFVATHDGANGNITLTMSNTITSEIDPGRYLYDVEVSSPSNQITRIAEGIVTVTPGITRI